MERAAACIEQGADVVVVDVAHGHAEHVLGMVRQLKSRFPGTPLSPGT
jgi:IMP dehydrogenase